MNHEKIDERQAKLLDAFIDRALEVAGREPVEPDLGGEKDVLALEARAAHAGPDLALVAVHLRGVEMAIAKVKGRLHQFDAGIVIERHRA